MCEAKTNRAVHAPPAGWVRLAVVFFLVFVGACNNGLPPPATSSERTLRDWINDLNSPSETTRFWAVNVLGDMGPAAKPALPALINAVHDPSKMVRKRVVWALVCIDPKGQEVLVYLYQATKDESADVRTTTVEMIGKLGRNAEPAVPELERLLKDEAAEVRRTAAWALGEIGPGALGSRAFLIDVSLNDRDPDVRRAAAEALDRLEKE
jgi:HEAT repeat protein